MNDLERCRVFIGSSSEGKEVASALHVELLSSCEVSLWSQGVFEPGGYTLDSLIDEAHSCDFAVLVATPDDTRESRGQTAGVPRDNVILEFGLFAGVLGRSRTYVLATDGVLLPTDTLGLTRLAYHTQQNKRSAVAEAVTQVRDRISSQGRRIVTKKPLRDQASEAEALRSELKKLAENASTQGWKVKDSTTALRLTSPKSKTYTLRKSTPESTREELRLFAAKVRAGGLRISSALRFSPSQSPYS